jgi:hypothetical protein
VSNKRNLFEIWKENGEKLLFRAVIDSWDPAKHFVVVEKVTIKNWPYGVAEGRYFFNGKPGERGVIRNAGTYRWVRG